MRFSSFVLPAVLLASGSAAAYGGVCLWGNCEGADGPAGIAATLADGEGEPCDAPCDKANKLDDAQPKVADGVLVDAAPVDAAPVDDDPCPYAKQAKAEAALADAEPLDDEPCDGKKSKADKPAAKPAFADARKPRS